MRPHTPSDPRTYELKLQSCIYNNIMYDMYVNSIRLKYPFWRVVVVVEKNGKNQYETNYFYTIVWVCGEGGGEITEQTRFRQKGLLGKYGDVNPYGTTPENRCLLFHYCFCGSDE